MVLEILHQMRVKRIMYRREIGGIDLGDKSRKTRIARFFTEDFQPSNEALFSRLFDNEAVHAV